MTPKIIVTREQPLTPYLNNLLKSAGFSAYHVPLICCSPEPIPDKISHHFNQADWILLTSAVSVRCLEDSLPKQIHIASVGHQTSLALKNAGYAIEFESQHPYALDLTKEWLALELSPQTILLPQSSLANPMISKQLRQAGHQVLDWVLYRTTHNIQGQKEALSYLGDNKVIWTFASPSAWQSFCDLKVVLPAYHRIAAIGKSTAKAIRKSGYEVDLMPDEPSMANMIKAIIQEEGRSNRVF